MADPDPAAVSEALPAFDLYTASSTRTSSSTSARDKLRLLGPQALSNTDLVTVVLGLRDRRVAAQLIRRHGLAAIAETTLPSIARSQGIGRGAALRLGAVLELARRLRALSEHDRPKLVKPKDVHVEVRDLRRAKKEHLVGLYLDAQNHLIHRETISIGSLNTTRTHPREILYPAITHSALGFILAHNHPSGNVEPSDEDIEFTRAVQRAGEIIGIDLYDHLIVSERGYTSLRERGVL